VTIAEIIPFRYVEFYDVPRVVVARHSGKLLLWLSGFNEKLDAYPDSYSVYVLPETVEPSLAKGSWEFLEDTNLPCLGEVLIKDVRFDATKRRTLDPGILDKLVPVE
jgi:hypothetical protein